MIKSIRYTAALLALSLILTACDGEPGQPGSVEEPQETGAIPSSPSTENTSLASETASKSAAPAQETETEPPAPSETINDPRNNLTGTVALDSLRVQYYEKGNRHPHINMALSNNANQAITGYEIAMLTFDENAKALPIAWYYVPSSEEMAEPCYADDDDRSHMQIHSDAFPAGAGIAPGETYNPEGGWSIFDRWTPSDTEGETGATEVEYVAGCIKSLTFENGAHWENPYFDHWLAMFLDQDASIGDFELMYPSIVVLD